MKPAGQFNRVMLRQGDDIEFDSDESDRNDGVEDEARFHSSNEPHLTSEALFLVGHQSKGSEAEE